MGKTTETTIRVRPTYLQVSVSVNMEKDITVAGTVHKSYDNAGINETQSFETEADFYKWAKANPTFGAIAVEAYENKKKEVEI